MDPVAAIDLGSNTIRLLVAACESEEPESKKLERRLHLQVATRLGEALQPGERLLPEAAARTWQALVEMKEHIVRAGARKVLAGGTKAIREAADGAEFLRRVHLELGFETIALSGLQEAELTTAGVLTVLSPIPKQAMIFDLGGRSTEMVLTRNGNTDSAISLDLGAVSLTEAHIHSDPPLEPELMAVRKTISDMLHRELPSSYHEAARPGSPIIVVGTAGTTTTLAAMIQELVEYRPEAIDNFRLDRRDLLQLYQRMIAAPTKQRAAMPGLAPDRADIIVAGASVVLEILNFFYADHLLVSDAGLLEGIWLAAAGKRSI